jgi:hypothetical protein
VFLPDNTPAPSFSAKAQVSDRPVSLQSTAGPLLLVFHSYQTAPVVAEVIRGVRNIYPSHDRILIAGVADMRVVPRFLRGAAKTIIRNAYEEAAKQVPPGQDPADHIIILPDWNGVMFKAYRVPDTSEQVALVLINDSKMIQGSYQGAQPVQASLSLLASGRISSDLLSTSSQ